jgi:hypothetical protein
VPHAQKELTLNTSRKRQVIVRESNSRHDAFELREAVMENTSNKRPSYWYSLADIDHKCDFANRVVERVFQDNGRTTYFVSAEPLTAFQLWEVTLDEYPDEEAVRIVRGLADDVMPSDLCDYVDLPQGSTYQEGREVL